MATYTALLSKQNRAVTLGFAGIGVVLTVFAIGRSNLLRSRYEASSSRTVAQHALRQESATLPAFAPAKAKSQGILGGTAPSQSFPDAPAFGQKLVRTSSMDLVVSNPSEVSEQIRQLAERMGGFLASAEMNGGSSAQGTLTVRVPAARFEEAREAIRKLGLRVESDRISAQDVTRQYVDDDASLRNLRAEESQYLSILKQARSVKDTLAVSEKLGDVRGQIEQQQAEFNALSKQVETAAITVSVRSEAQAQAFGIHWRPLYQLKSALRDGLDALGTYAAAMTSILFYLPAILLWTGTILAAAVIGWRVKRLVLRTISNWQNKQAA